MLLSDLEFGSYLTYTPKPQTEDSKKAKNLLLSIKFDTIRSESGVPTSKFIIDRLMESLEKLPFKDYFGSSTSLVPVPKSSLMQEGSLWVPEKYAEELSRNGKGVVFPCLKRVSAVAKAAFSQPENRPKATEHYNSIKVKSIMHVPREIVLIDDVVTRGATLLGCASRLKQAYPDVRIRGFAIVRTISDPSLFNKIADPCIGKITLNGDDTIRSP
jgi:hypothetical protein